MANKLLQAYVDRTVLLALLNPTTRTDALVSLFKEKSDVELYTSTLTAELMLERMSSKDAQTAAIQLRDVLELAGNNVTRVAPFDHVMTKMRLLREKAYSKGLKLPRDIKYELAVADQFRIQTYLTYNPQMDKFKGLTNTRISFIHPEAAIKQGFLAFGGKTDDNCEYKRSHSARAADRSTATSGPDAPPTEAAPSQKDRELARLLTRPKKQ